MKEIIDIAFLKKNDLIIFEGISGSRAYGTNLPTSDTDIRGVFILPQDYILGFGYVDQVSDKTNDITYYEIKRFLELVATNNPNILELLNLPKDCILIQDPCFDLILEHKDEFITKQCKNSFGGYAIQQIKKAQGYNKKINWEENEMVRKSVLDFCYVLVENHSMLFEKWVDEQFVDLTYNDFSLAKIDHAHDLYALYRMYEPELKGFIGDIEKSADIRLHSIPKNRSVEDYLTFNKDAYSLHCKKYKEYKDWLKNRNEDRFKMNKDHGKNYDSKNMMHCIRLLDMGHEIANGEIIVRRSPADVKLLMSIRKGEMEFNDLLNMADKKMEKMDNSWDTSSLPAGLDKEFINDLLLAVRKDFYQIN